MQTTSNSDANLNSKNSASDKSFSSFLKEIADKLTVLHALIILLALFLIYIFVQNKIKNSRNASSNLQNKENHFLDKRFEHTSFFNESIKDEKTNDLVIFRKNPVREKKKEKITSSPKEKKHVAINRKKNTDVLQRKKKENENSYFENKQFIPKVNSTTNKQKQNSVAPSKTALKNRTTKNEAVVQEIEPIVEKVEPRGNTFKKNQKKPNYVKDEIEPSSTKEVERSFEKNDFVKKEQAVEKEQITEEEGGKRFELISFKDLSTFYKKNKYQYNKNARKTLIKRTLKEKKFFKTDKISSKIKDLELFDGIRLEENNK